VKPQRTSALGQPRATFFDRINETEYTLPLVNSLSRKVAAEPKIWRGENAAWFDIWFGDHDFVFEFLDVFAGSHHRIGLSSFCDRTFVARFDTVFDTLFDFFREADGVVLTDFLRC